VHKSFNSAANAHAHTHTHTHTHNTHTHTHMHTHMCNPWLQGEGYKAPKQIITDPEELGEYRLRKRKFFEDTARRVGRFQHGVWSQVMCVQLSACVCMLLFVHCACVGRSQPLLWCNICCVFSTLRVVHGRVPAVSASAPIYCRTSTQFACSSLQTHSHKCSMLHGRSSRRISGVRGRCGSGPWT